jgi:DNA-binding XRE family transcriptional regulator
MSECPCCGRDEVLSSQRRLARAIGGRWFSTMITIVRCEACDWSPLPVDQIEEHERSIATRVALFGPVTTETFRFLRRQLALGIEETARLLNVDAETVMRIENGTDMPSVDAWMMLARSVRDRAASGDLPESARPSLPLAHARRSSNENQRASGNS